MMIRKIISGGQTGADQAGLVVAKRFGLETGGTMPKGYKTLTGPRPEFARLYNIAEHESDNYVPRTHLNANHSDGTIRLAGDFSSRGEILTLNCVKKYKKPHFDVDLSDPPPVAEFINWLTENKIEVLNVAGNSDQTFAGAFQKSVSFLMDAFFSSGLEMVVADDDILRALGLDPAKMILYAEDRMLVDRLRIRRIGVRLHRKETTANLVCVGNSE